MSVLSLAKGRRGRILLVCGFVLLGFAADARRLWRLATNEDGKSCGRVNSIATSVIPSFRGAIYDRDGRKHPLAISRVWWKVAYDPSAVRDTNQLARIHDVLDGYGVFAPDRVDRALAERVKRYNPIGEMDVKAVRDDLATNPVVARCTSAERIDRRTYPPNRILCHVLGALRGDGVPRSGIEATLDRILRGTDGVATNHVSATREVIERIDTVPPQDGADVFLSIDLRLQEIVEEALDEGIAEFHPQAAWAVVQDPWTGEILALASRPAFDPARFYEATAAEQMNNAIGRQYEPGSVMKSFAAAAALESGLVSTNTMLDVTPGLYCGKPLRDHTHGQSELSLTQVLSYSSNRGAARLGMALGKDRQQAFLKAFGFGSKTGIPLPGELKGATVGDGSALNHIRVSMGQGMTATAIQLATGYSAFANGGKVMKPILVKGIDAADGSPLLRETPKVVSTPISERTARDMRFMLSRVAIRGEGTARRAAVRGYTVAGKTGTAQMAVRGGYSQTDYHSSFIGFLPAFNPRLTILVTMAAPRDPEHPGKGVDGGVCSAPVFRKIAEEAMALYRVEPDRPEELE